MATQADTSSKLRALAQEAHNIVNDPAKSGAQKKSLLDKLEAESAKLAIEAERQKFGAGALGDIVDRPTSGVIDNKSLIDPPAFTIGAQQAAELYEAATSFQHKSIDLKATTTSDAPMAAIPDYRLPPLAYRREPLRIIDLLPVSPTDRGEVDFFQITTPAQAASTVAEGDLKPTSTLAYEKKTAPVRKIAQLLTVTDETLNDYGAFLSVISEELLAGLAHEENKQLVAGSGTGVDLVGMLNTPNILTQPKGGDTALDAVLKGITAIRTGASFLEADGIVCNPVDYQTLVLAKDSQLRYLATSPVTANPYELWGLTVKVTTQCPAGTLLVGAFRDSVQVFLRLGPRLDVNPFSESEWKRNQTVLRCEERIGLAVTRPTGLCKVTGL